MYHMFRAIRCVLDEYDDVKAICPIHLNVVVCQAVEDVFWGIIPERKGRAAASDWGIRCSGFPQLYEALLPHYYGFWMVPGRIR